MTEVALASRTFTAQDQFCFARLSGDFNPLHMDPVAARKSDAGQPIVHGIHGVLWALDQIARARIVTAATGSLKVNFARFIPVGSTVELKLLQHDEKSVRAEILLGGLTATRLTLTRDQAGKSKVAAWQSGMATPPKSDQPLTWVDLAELTPLSGRVASAVPDERLADAFANAASIFGAERIAAIAALSRLVGMICPGLYSLFAALALDFVASASKAKDVAFRVARTDPRFRLVQMEVSGAGIAGSVDAFLRWPPVKQAALADIVKLVAPGEFAGATALIVGGSRGLGALTAKVIAAGGGHVAVTYASGKDDASQLAAEINEAVAPGRCQTLHYDAREPAGDQLGPLTNEISHLYYFATSGIYRQKADLFLPALFDEFVQIYVKGFYDCCEALRRRGSRAVTAFYPSSVFVEQQPQALAEYSMAKAAGEALCAAMSRGSDGMRVIVERLPRLLTDQTASVPPVRTADPLEVMLPIIRKVQSPAAPASRGGPNG